MPSPSKQDVRLRNYYVLFLEVGTVVSLLLLTVSMHLDWSPSQEFEVTLEEQEVVEMEEVQQTEQESEPPPPPRPPAPVEIPNDAVVEQEDVDFDASLNLEDELDVGQEPPSPDRGDEDESQEEAEIFVAVEQQPDCGGMEALQEEMEYPEFAQRAGLEGRVFVRFVVDENGNVTNPEVTRGVHKLLDKEALRVIQQLKCTPGKQRGTPVKVRMSLPVTFTLRDRAH